MGVNEEVMRQDAEIRAILKRLAVVDAVYKIPFIKELVEHGLNADLHPTMYFQGKTPRERELEEAMYAQWVRYLGSIDQSLRDRAREALGE